MKKQYSYSGENPTAIQSIGTVDKPKYQINFDTEQELTEGMNGQSHTQYKSLYVQVTSLSYEAVVAAIITSRYNSNDIEAIVLNNMDATDANTTLADDKKSEYIIEYQNLQSWRAHAKEVAANIIV